MWTIAVVTVGSSTISSERVPDVVSLRRTGRVASPSSMDRARVLATEVVNFLASGCLSLFDGGFSTSTGVRSSRVRLAISKRASGVMSL